MLSHPFIPQSRAYAQPEGQPPTNITITSLSININEIKKYLTRELVSKYIYIPSCTLSFTPLQPFNPQAKLTHHYLNQSTTANRDQPSPTAT